MLKHDDLCVTFIKKTTGEQRVLKCTNNVPKQYQLEERTNRSQKPDFVTVFDYEAMGWRSFYLEHVEFIELLDTRFELLQE